MGGGSFTQTCGNLELGFNSPFAESSFQAPVFNPNYCKQGHYSSTNKKGGATNHFDHSATSFQPNYNGFQTSLFNQSFSAGGGGPNTLNRYS